MSTDNIIVIFDISKTIYVPWLNIVFAVVPVFFGITASFWFDRPGGVFRARLASIIFCVLSAMILWSLLSEYVRLTDAYKTGHFLIAEGPVTEFHRDFGDGKTPETFVVDGVRFEMMGSSQGSEFHATIGFGGPDLRRRCLRVLYAPNPRLRENPIIWLGIIPGCVGPREPA